METKIQTHTPANKPLHPIAWVAGVAVILFSAIGIGAFMGWIPDSMSVPSDKVAVVPQASTPAKPRAAAAPAPRAAPAQIANNTPTVFKCAECGVVESVREIVTQGQGTGLGAVGGAVVGGVLGNQVGGGSGKDIATIAGAVGGAVAGNEVEKRVKASKHYAITVRFDDGTRREISEPNPPTWRIGDKVKVVNGSIRSNA